MKAMTTKQVKKVFGKWTRMKTIESHTNSRPCKCCGIRVWFFGDDTPPVFRCPKCKGINMVSLCSCIDGYESGELEEEYIHLMFQYLIDTKVVWSLQGSLYGSYAVDLIQAGICHQ